MIEWRHVAIPVNHQVRTLFGVDHLTTSCAQVRVDDFADGRLGERGQGFDGAGQVACLILNHVRASIEARADLVALYFMADDKLLDIGVYDTDVVVHDAALAQYVSYLTNGAIGQLRRVTLGSDLKQAHFRNRQLIATWVLEKGDPSKVAMVEKDGHYYVEVHDVAYVRGLFGQLLAIVQRIKSTGDADGAGALVMRYGTNVNAVIHEELLERLSTLDMPKVTGFITPMLQEIDRDVVLAQTGDFLEQQLQLHLEYVLGQV